MIYMVEQPKETIIKIIQVKSRKRITFPKAVRDILNIKDNDHLMFIKDNQPGVRIQKVTIEIVNSLNRMER